MQEIKRDGNLLRRAGVIILCLVLLAGILYVDLPKVSAGTYDNAVTYYRAYGNRMIFVPAGSDNGYIYYATRAKRTSSNILFSNIGWKAIVKDAEGKKLQEIYYKMDGNYLKTKDIRTASDGYEYSLYAVTLKDFKSRLNATTRAALASGDCSIVFDACIIVKRNGIAGGGMTDNGISWGTVYTTYHGIVNAEEWSTVTQNALLSYYDKVVEGLFYQVTLKKDSGIARVLGAGNYCYGTVVNIYAIPKSGYSFYRWSGSGISSLAKTSVTVTKDLTYRASSVLNRLVVTYYRNHNPKDSASAQRSLYYGRSGQKLTDFGWKKTGYYQTGWKHDRSALGADYALTESVNSAWIKGYLPRLNLYGNWSPNRYTVYFDPNGAYPDWEPEKPGYPQMETKDVNYESVVTLPECEYEHDTSTFLGWSTKADDTTPQFSSLEEVTVESVAKKLGIENSDGASIVFYAIWDKMPAIEASNIYVSLANANAGKVTEGYIASFARASDKEDGEIPYGKQGNISFVLEDYDGDIYRNAKEEGYVTETFAVTDSTGNTAKRSIRVYLVDTTIYTEAEFYGEVRFIDAKYFLDEDGGLVTEENGGLDEDSIWRQEEEFLEVLKSVFGKL